MSKEVILTGLRSNAEFHLGNYLGAILPMVDIQKQHAGQYQLNMFIPDLHSFTTPVDHDSLYNQSLQNIKMFIAAGLNINQSDTYIYRQSYIPAHSEMTWILNCFTYFGELARMTEFKEKSAQQDSVTAGLFDYPVLMAADILLYGAKWVPVGEDQRQHLEFTRDLAIRINNKFGELLVVPEENTKQIQFLGLSEPVRIRSLRNPDKKMSKSVDDPTGTIMLTDDPQQAASKILASTTDSLASIRLDWEKQPGISNLLQILALLTKKSVAEVAGEWSTKNSYSDLKSSVAEAVKSFLTEFQDKLAKVNDQEILSVLTKDEQVISERANATLLKVQQAVGLRPKNQ